MLRQIVIIELFSTVINNINDNDILKRIHNNRIKNKKLSENILQFLLLEYKKNYDIRFFNELLWCTKNQKYIKPAISVFKTQINFNGTYKFCYNSNLEYCLIQKETKLNNINYAVLKGLKICLIGTPVHFIYPYFIFKKHGIEVEIINISYHKNLISNFIFNNWILFNFYKILFKKDKYFKYNIRNKKQLQNLILPKKYDIGFHKLSFIIPESITNQFSGNLINDHWGVLPLFKGRSTINYSKLFGAKLIITNHLITKEIDSGKIICYYKINEKRIKRDIYLKLGKRIINSILLLANGSFENNIDNKNGITFYEMHPWLIKYIKRHEHLLKI